MKTVPAYLAAAALLLGGCATTYQLTLMPRDSGKQYTGTLEAVGAAEGRISITLEDKVYSGTWVQTSPDRANAYVTGGLGIGWGLRRYGGIGLGSTIYMDNPEGTTSKALLSAADGSGLRCDFRAGNLGRGGGLCRDDRGREYDVQFRATPS